MFKIGIIGATGYTGQELIEILCEHPVVRINYLSAKVEEKQSISKIFSSLIGKIDLLCGELNMDEALKAADIFFLAVPHTVAMEIAPKLLKENKKVIDLSADFRLKNVKVYQKWYEKKHKAPQLLAQAVYGLPELYRDKIKKAQLIANPGCYPTSVILGLAPLLEGNYVNHENIIIDAKTGITGAGRKAALPLIFSEVNENIRAYKINEHQHMCEIEQELSRLSKKKASITFVPHVVPLNRGIMSTMYVKFKKDVTPMRLIELYKNFYRNEPFIRILDYARVPEIKDVCRTNYCSIGMKLDETHKSAVIVSVIDNLGKGAAHQAIQNMNIMCGYVETLGLK
ncbi:MAG: N-acetyl-gamma-glutamyl-phosphate reductase [Candidatus Omnitrophota bacterium]